MSWPSLVSTELKFLTECLIIIGNYHASITSCYVFTLLEAKTSYVSDCSSFLSLIFSEERLSTVLYQSKFILFSYLNNWIHVTGMTINMNNYDSFCSATYFLFYIVWLDSLGFRINISKYWNGVLIQNCYYCSHISYS